MLGIAGFVSRDSAKETHKGLLFGMYVRPVARGTGVARRLVEWVVDFARSNVELIQLSVVVGNEPARRLYARLGFVEYGIEQFFVPEGEGRERKPGPFRITQERIPEESRQHVQRRGDATPLQPRAALRGNHGHVEAGLQRGVRAHAEPVEQAAVGGAAPQEHVLAGVDHQVVPGERHRGAAEPRLGLEQRDVRAGLGERYGGRDAG